MQRDFNRYCLEVLRWIVTKGSFIMKNNVVIQGERFPEEEVADLYRENEFGITFSVIESKNIVDVGVLFVFIELVRNLSYNASYDILKYIFNCIIVKISHLKKEKIHIEVICNKSKSSITINFPLSDEQKDKLIDAAIKKLIDG